MVISPDPNVEFAKFIDKKSADYCRKNDDTMDVKANTLGQFLAPIIRLYLEREQDRR